MKQAFTTKLKFPWIFVVMILLSCACEEAEPIKETQTQVIDEQVDQAPVRYERDNTIIPNQYIVLLKKNSPTGLYPELASIGEKPYRNQRTTAGMHQSQMKAAEVDVKAIGSTIVEKHGISRKGIRRVYDSAVPGFVIKMNASEADELRNDPDVALVHEDRILALNVAPLSKTPFVPSGINLWFEWQPYGVRRIGGSVDVENDSEYTNKRVWIVDTGIDADHPDLNVDETYSADFTGENDYNDTHGHGTHVAGIVGAKANNYGVSGVAAGIKVVAIKVLDSEGAGTVSGLIAGLDHIKRYCMPEDVVNVSLGGQTDAAVIETVNGMENEGIHIVVAAGNEGVDAINTTPANINQDNVYTIAAINWWDKLTSYSNYGQMVDFASPGHGILSTVPGGKYTWMSGTSMAAPHVAGILAITGENYSESGTTNTPTGAVPIMSH